MLPRRGAFIRLPVDLRVVAARLGVSLPATIVAGRLATHWSVPLALLLPAALADRLLIQGHYFLAAMATYGLARVLGLGRAAALVAVLAYPFGQHFVARPGQIFPVMSVFWLLAILLCSERGMQRAGRTEGSWPACCGRSSSFGTPRRSPTQLRSSWQAAPPDGSVTTSPRGAPWTDGKPGVPA